MDNEVITQTKADREILSFDVSDELLERAANAQQKLLEQLRLAAVGANSGSLAVFAAIRRASWPRPCFICEATGNKHDLDQRRGRVCPSIFEREA